MELLQNPGLPDGDEVVLDSYKCHNFGHTAKYCQKKRKSADIAQRTQIAKGMFLKTIPTKNLVIITREAKSESHIESDPIKDELWPIKTLKTNANYVYLSWTCRDRSVSLTRLCGLWISIDILLMQKPHNPKGKFIGFERCACDLRQTRHRDPGRNSGAKSDDASAFMWWPLRVYRNDRDLRPNIFD